MDPKPGYKTTEFWLTLVGEVVQALLAMSGDYAAPGLLTLVYNVSRALVKGGLIRGMLGKLLTGQGTVPTQLGSSGGH